MQVETRPFTVDERRVLLEAGKVTREQVKGEKYLAGFAIFVAAMLVFALAAKFLPAIKQYQVYYMLLTGLVSLVLAHKWSELIRSVNDTSDIDSDLKNGIAEVSTFDVKEAVAVKELEDEGLHYYLDIGGGKAVYLSGQYLYEFENSKQFPSTRFQIVRSINTKTVFNLKPLGSYLSPSRTLPAFTKADWENNRIPCDGEILNLDLVTLK